MKNKILKNLYSIVIFILFSLFLIFSWEWTESFIFVLASLYCFFAFVGVAFFALVTIGKIPIDDYEKLLDRLKTDEDIFIPFNIGVAFILIYLGSVFISTVYILAMIAIVLMRIIIRKVIEDEEINI